MYLLYEVLCCVFGDYVVQCGSLNVFDWLWFDFSYIKVLMVEEIVQVEVEVNDFICQNILVDICIMIFDDVCVFGVQVLFGEKYGDEVCVVLMGQFFGFGKGNDGVIYLLEFCGGMYVGCIGDIGMFVLILEIVLVVGICWIEVLIGQVVMVELCCVDCELFEIVGVLKVQVGEVVIKVCVLVEECKLLVNEVVQLKCQFVMGGGNDDVFKEINGIKLIVCCVDGVFGKEFGLLVDEMKVWFGLGVVVVLVDVDGKVIVVVGVMLDLIVCVIVVELVQVVIVVFGGKGGGGCLDRVQGGVFSFDVVDSVIVVIEMLIGEKV